MMDTIKDRLFGMQDKKYRDFQGGLTPTVSGEKMIGVRTPDLRSLAKELSGSREAEEFLSALPHEYFEENQVHAFLLERIRDFDAALAAVEAFLPYVDNWATCDQMNPKALSKKPDVLLERVRVWIKDPHEYTVRFAIKMLMNHFLEKRFAPAYPEMVAKVDREEYYIRMMAAWYFATALAKQYDTIIPYIEERRLPEWVHKKAIQKAVESYRIDEEKKAYLRSLRTYET